ncbi:MAG: hypothetical protein ACRENG_11505, partial [bacterium]
MQNQSPSLLSGRKGALLIGGALVAVIAVVYFSFFYPSLSQDEAAGTIGGVKKAEKYRAGQMSEADVVLTSAQIQNLLQNDKIQKLVENKEFQTALQSPAFQALLSNVELQAALKSPELQAALQNAELQAALKSPELQAALQNAELQAALKSPE